MLAPVLLHASCAARGAQGVLLLGAPGAGKSDLLLRLLDRGYDLVADDQVALDGLSASAPARLAGLIEVRGLGIVRMAFRANVVVVLAVGLQAADRLPMPDRYEILDLPMISVDPFAASAPLVIGLALDGIAGVVSFVAGAFG